MKQHFENLAIGEADRAAGLLLMARKIFDYFQSSVQRRAGILTLQPFPEMYQTMLNDLLDPTNGLPRVYRDRLRTEKGLPPEPATATNAPPAR